MPRPRRPTLKYFRNDVAAQIRAEQEKLRVENIQQTYEVGAVNYGLSYRFLMS